MIALPLEGATRSRGENMPSVASSVISYKSRPHGVQWRVSKDDILVTVYSIQVIAERAATRLAMASARQGLTARTLFYRDDGTVGAEQFYRLPAAGRP